MAVRFDAYADRLLYSGTPASMSAYTFATWLRIVTDRNDYSIAFAIETSSLGVEFNELGTEADGTTLKLFDHSGGGTAVLNFGALTVGTNYFVAYSVGTSGAGVGYIAAENASSITRVTGTVSVMTLAHHCTIGTTDFAEFWNGRLANARLWDAVLTDNEVANERWRRTPGRRSNLRAWWPLLDSTTKLVDYSGNGNNLTSPGAGAWQTEDGPGLIGRRRKTVTVSTVSSSVTGTGAATLGTMTGAASGTETMTGTASTTLAAMTGSAAGTETFTGTAAANLSAMTGAASGAETFTGTSSATLAAMTGASSGAETFTGTAAATLAAMTGAASGVETATGAGAATLAAMIAGAAGAETVSGTGAVTLAAMTGTGSGTVTIAGVAGSGASTLAAMTGSATGTSVAGVTGTGAATLAAMAASAAGTVTAGGLYAHWRMDDARNAAIADELGGLNLVVTTGATGYPKRRQGKLRLAREWSRENVSLHTPGNVVVGDSIAEGTVTNALIAAFCDAEWATSFWFKRRPLDAADSFVTGANAAGIIWSFYGGGKASVYGNIETALASRIRFSNAAGGIFQALSVTWTGSGPIFGIGGSFTAYNPPVGEWVHVVVNKAHVSGRMVPSLYVNGVLTQTLTASIAGLPVHGAYPFGVPRFSLGASRVRLISSVDPAEPEAIAAPLSGWLDDLRLYNRLLTAQEIADLYAYREPYLGRFTQHLLSDGRTRVYLSDDGRSKAALLHDGRTEARLSNDGLTTAEDE